MAKTRLVGGLFVIILLLITMTLAGCKKDKEQKALAEGAAQARAEVIKAKSEIVQLKSEISYLNEKLAAATQARDRIQIQIDKLLEDQNAVATDADDLQKENDKLRKVLAEQIKKSNELGKQVENLKAVIREFQTRIEPNKLPEHPPISIEETPAGK